MTRVPIGISDFEKIRTGDYYFVDKSMFIADILRSGAEVTLLPRPRRFGKTLNLSMLRHFLDMDRDSRPHFKGLAVEKQSDVYAQLGSRPTVYLTFKDVKAPDFENCIRAIGRQLAYLFQERQALVLPEATEGFERTLFTEIAARTSQTDDLQDALFLLTRLLHRVTGRKVVVLIDEYDMPIHAGHQYGYYAEIIAFMRNLLSSAFKDNPHLHKGVVTGILRVAKESIFSGFNNCIVHTLIDEEYAPYFGFTEDEVVRALDAFSLGERIEEIRAWYNGYRFGTQTVYNPWSIIRYIHGSGSVDQAPEPYWVNTSDNEMIRSLIVEEQTVLVSELEALLQGGTVQT